MHNLVFQSVMFKIFKKKIKFAKKNMKISKFWSKFDKELNKKGSLLFEKSVYIMDLVLCGMLIPKLNLNTP